MRSRGSEVDNGRFLSGNSSDDFMNRGSAHGAAAAAIGLAGPDGRPDAGFAEFVAAIDLRNLGGRDVRQADGAFEGFVECEVPDGLCDKLVGRGRLLENRALKHRPGQGFSGMPQKILPAADRFVVNVLSKVLRFKTTDAHQSNEIVVFGGKVHVRVLGKSGKVSGVESIDFVIDSRHHHGEKMKHVHAVLLFLFVVLVLNISAEVFAEGVPVIGLVRSRLRNEFQARVAVGRFVEHHFAEREIEIIGIF